MASENGKLRDDSPRNEHAAREKMSVTRYLSTRLPTLKPPLAKAPNPLSLVRLLNLQQWLFFLVAFLAWTWDAFDFFTVSLTVEQLAEEFDKVPSQITWGITLVLSTTLCHWPNSPVANHVVQCSDRLDQLFLVSFQ